MLFCFNYSDYCFHATPSVSFSSLSLFGWCCDDDDEEENNDHDDDHHNDSNKNNNNDDDYHNYAFCMVCVVLVDL